MVRIASHLIKGSPQSALSEALGRRVDYTPVCPWPDDCTVQWGNGIIPANPFFEAFPPGTFIRGDGETIEEAERNAFAQYDRERGCAHVWGRFAGRRGTYLNGAGWCRHCDAFRSSMFAPVFQFGAHRKPLNRMEEHYLGSVETDADLNVHMDRTYPADRDRRRKHARMLRLRMNLFGAISDQQPRAPLNLGEGSRDDLNPPSQETTP